MNIQKLIRYGLVGVVTVLLDLLIYGVLLRLGLHYLLADLLKIPVVLTFNFLAQKYFTFRTSGRSTGELARYLGNVAVQYVLAAGILFVGIDVLGLDPYLSKLAQVVILPLVTYVALNRFVFKNQRK